MKKILRQLVLCAMVVLMGIHTLAPIASADEAEEEALLQQIKEQLIFDLIDDPDVADCEAKLVPLFDAELISFFRFLDATFKNKSSNSSMVNLAIAAFHEYKVNLKQHVVRLRPIDDGSASFEDYTSEYAAYQKCGQITDAYTQLAKEQLIKQVRTSSSQKQTTVLVEKYQAINEKMRVLHFQIGQMFGYFETFDNKLPGFLSECVVSN